MQRDVIYSNEYLQLIVQPDGVYIETFKRGFSLYQLNTILQSHPDIDITNFNVLKSSVNNAPQPLIKIGKMKERISIDIVNDGLKAFIVYNLSGEELDIQNRENLVRETSVKLAEKGIVFGINTEFLTGEIKTGKSYIIAEGISPVHGDDSIIKMYELEEPKPTISDDGKVDFYELKLINRVNIGDWLGERIEATDGIPGKSITGEVIKPIKGKNFPLIYDRNTVMEILDNNKTVLYSRVSGAVNYTHDGKISVSNHLEIDGNVDFKTGNIKFDGYLTIKGTVADGFSVEATRDIEINSPFGLGSVKGITSTQGNIYIKGGIASKRKVEIRAAKNVFTKFVDNAIISCGGLAHIGFYCINSEITAGEVFLESSSSQIMGGNITAEIRVIAAILGSEIEKKTMIEVTGFDRSHLKTQLDAIFQGISDLRNEQQKIKQILAHYDSLSQLNPFQRKEYNDSYERLLAIKQQIKDMEEKRKTFSSYLKTRGEGEISATKKIYPNCILTIKKNTVETTSLLLATSYYVQDDELKHS